MAAMHKYQARRIASNESAGAAFRGSGPFHRHRLGNERDREECMRVRLSACLAGCLIACLVPHAAHAQADFYKGKTVTIVVGTRVGGSIGNTSLILSRHLGRYIPGNPTVILRQMPGGAHLNATNHVFNVAEADGLTILGANPAIAMAQLSKVQAVRFDVRQFQWLGSTGPDGTLFAIRSSHKSSRSFRTPSKRSSSDPPVPLELPRCSLLLKECRAKFNTRWLPGKRRYPPRAGARRSRRMVRAIDADSPGRRRRQGPSAGARS
jgi:hypothetical protein